MAKGDVWTYQASVANGAYQNIQPGVGYEAHICNFWGSGAIEVYQYDGTNEVLVNEVNSSPYAIAKFIYPVNNTYYLRIKNVSGGTIYVGFSGIYTKVGA